jgi:hypothetical protein
MLGRLANGGLLDIAAVNDITANTVATTRAIALRAGANINLVDLASATGTVNLTSGAPQGASTSYSLAGDTNITGTVSAPATLTIAAGGDVRMSAAARLRANSTIAITSGDDIILAAGGDIGQSNTSTIDINAGATRNGQPNLDANGASTLAVDGTIDGISITARSGDVAIGGSSLIGSGATNTLTLINNGVNAMTIGGSGGASGYVLADAEFARLQAASLRLSGKGVAGATPDVTVDTLTVHGSLTPSGTRLNIFGKTALLTIDSAADIRVVGGVALGGAAATDTLAVTAGGRIDVVLPGGSIAITDNSNALTGTLIMTAPTIQMATEKASNDIKALTDVAALDQRLGVADGQDNDAGYVRVGTVTFNIKNALFTQNSNPLGLRSTNRAGITLGQTGLIAVNSPASSFPLIVLNGRQPTIGALFTGGADLTKSVRLNGVAPPLTAIPQSLINGCSFAATPLCAFDMLLDQSNSGGKDSKSSNNSNDSDDGGGTASMLGSAMIQMSALEGVGATPIIDEPITASGNDDLWDDGAATKE